MSPISLHRPRSSCDLGFRCYFEGGGWGAAAIFLKKHSCYGNRLKDRWYLCRLALRTYDMWGYAERISINETTKGKKLPYCYSVHGLIGISSSPWQRGHPCRWQTLISSINRTAREINHADVTARFAFVDQRYLRKVEMS